MRPILFFSSGNMSGNIEKETRSLDMLPVAVEG